VSARHRREGRGRSFARSTKRRRTGDRLAFADPLSGIVAGKNADGSIELSFNLGGTAFLAALERVGGVPLPPYIRGGVGDARDRADYQTMFAERDGSVAAPTAALHFTPALMAALADAGIATARATLPVGAR